MYADDTQVYGFCRSTTATTLTANILTDCVEAATSWVRSDRGFNRIQTRQSSCGVRSSDDNINCQRRRCWSTAAPSLRSSLLATSASTSTATCRCGRMFNVPCHGASLRYVRFVALYTVGHTSDGSGRTGALPAGLWNRRAGRPSGSPDASTPVGSECDGPTDLAPEDSRPHNWCSHQSALVAGSGTNNKLAVLAYRVLHGDAPRCPGPLIGVDDLPGRRPLRSTNTNRLVVPQVKLSTVGSRAFAVAAPDIWNRLPTDVVAANSLSTFRRLLTRFYSGNHILV